SLSTPLYRTGDMARWLPDGNLEFLGRGDQQVKIRGFRVELKEIEFRLLKHEGIRESVVIVKGGGAGDDEKYLCAYIVVHSPAPAVTEVREFLSEQLPRYMVPGYIVTVEKIPLTANGKVDVKALPDPETGFSENDYVAPRDENEEKLAEIWSELLGIEPRRIGINSSFFDMGGHSLKAGLMVSEIHKVFNVVMPLVQVFETPTIRELARYIKKKPGGGGEFDSYVSIERAEDRDFYPLSSAQKRMFFIQQLDPESVVYNVPVSVVLEGTLDRHRLEQAFRRLVVRHESLRTSFLLIEKEPVQKIHRHVEFEIEYFDFPTGDPGTPVRPFNFSQAPLMRAVLVREDAQRHTLAVDIHHIVTDGFSMEILVREMMAVYGGGSLPELTLQYKDFSQWQNRLFQTAWLKRRKAYWKGQFEDEVPVLNLPTDFPRPSFQGFEGGKFHFDTGSRMAGELNKIAREGQVTLYMILSAGFYVFLSKISGQEDIVMGAPIAGRSHADLKQVVGLFVNTLALRNRPTGDKTFMQFLKEVKECILAAFDNQDYPFEELVELVEVRRDAGRNPLFDVLFNLLNVQQPGREIPEIEDGGLRLKPYKPESDKNTVSKFDMHFSAVETEDNILLGIEYSTRLFTQDTIRRFSGYFKTILSVLIENSAIKLSGLEIISGEEKQQILEEFNNTGVDYPKEKTIPQLFEEQAAKNPDNIAVADMDVNSLGIRQLSYRQLNKKSEQLTRLLQEKGAGSGTIVGIMLGRSVDMTVAVLGILKSGSAYLPIAPDYPENRVNYMLNDSNTTVLLRK
ncbi:MAG: AMP-binding protein, partial [bacterium]|nr:AMP-binding protein [bacterium]